MGTVPVNKVGKIEFYETHIDQWSSNALAIGLSVAECGALASLVTTARADLVAQEIAADDARSATGTCNTSVGTMHSLGATMIAKIRAFAEATNSPGVYSLANIPPRADPTTVGPPGQCVELTVSLLIGGQLQLRWKSTNPENAGGTVYEVRRKIGSSPFIVIGAAGGDKTFIDDTLPVGSTGVVYELTGIRSTRRGLANQFNVNFGVGGGGGFTVTQVTPEAKLAA